MVGFAGHDTLTHTRYATTVRRIADQRQRSSNACFEAYTADERDSIYKGSAPRAADAARYARARQENMQLKTCEGGRKKRPMIWCEQRFDNAKSCLCRANCPAVVSCAVCFCYRCYVLIGSTGIICVGENAGGRERSHRKKKKSSTQQHVLHIPGTALMFERKHTAQHDTAPQRRSRHCTYGSARRYAALLGYV